MLFLRLLDHFYLRKSTAFSLWYAFLLSLTVLVASTAAFASEKPDVPKSGLLWNKSALPSVFPLQVKTPSGPNYYMTLTDTDTKEQILAAFIVGGQFFQILVPPGTFSLRFSYGENWQDEHTLFGSGQDTGVFELDTPLKFEIRGVGTKAGHLIDLRPFMEEDEVALVFPQSICQSLEIEVERSPELDDPIKNAYAMDEESPLERSALSDDILLGYPVDEPSLTRRYTVRSRVCG